MTSKAFILLFSTIIALCQIGSVSADDWKKAALTWYTSYAPCCEESPNYDPQASKEECEDFSACDHLGDFTAIGHQSFDWVKSNNIVSFYDDSDRDGNNFMSKYGGRTIKLRKNGKEFTALIADTCGNDDCNDCCRQNSKNGFLVDMEEWTVKRNFGTTDEADGTIEFQLL